MIPAEVVVSLFEDACTLWFQYFWQGASVALCDSLKRGMGQPKQQNNKKRPHLSPHFLPRDARAHRHSEGQQGVMEHSRDRGLEGVDQVSKESGQSIQRQVVEIQRPV